MKVKSNLHKIKSRLPKQVTLVAVTKTKPIDAILEAYHTNHKIFGENKVQELILKQQQLPKDISWHMIGHLQRNKVKHIAPFIALIHAVDNLKLLQEINKQALKHNRSIDCLLQIKIASEDTKFGMSADDALKLFQSKVFSELKHVNVVGLMGMATYTDNKDQIKREFSYLKSIFNTLKTNTSFNFNLKVLSMGMSNDYDIAITEGSNMIRIGSHIFGDRNY